MPDDRIGEYRLRRRHAGVGYFGQVRVRLTAVGEGTSPVTWEVDPDDGSSLQPGPDREFVDAAVAGAGDGLDLVTGCGVDPAGAAVEVVHAQLDLTDIEVSAVRTAAALAVADAFGVADRLRPVFRQGWTVDVAS
ncbi:hypothetical protein GCM10022243_17580 [Saccharothrix violaceirubra]|uniref:Uncharacterized protein n=1 Tax=Saccharothrix violaceirubra TaxID=413306 RepID=A0A7W7SYW5_9PSEU|nr:hypothetical protein [Saccharothrix violaceirubra]MBB4963501.1 hypothetical protein [Saccharothrix violaceirubra]